MSVETYHVHGDAMSSIWAQGNGPKYRQRERYCIVCGKKLHHYGLDRYTCYQCESARTAQGTDIEIIPLSRCEDMTGDELRVILKSNFGNVRKASIACGYRDDLLQKYTCGIKGLTLGVAERINQAAREIWG